MSAASGRKDNLQTLIQHMDEKNLMKVAIIDDAYDLPVVADISPAVIESFVAEINGDDEARHELTERGLSINSTNDIVDELLQQLWSSRFILGPLKRHCEALFGDVYVKQSSVEPLYKVLHDDLGREVSCLGARGQFEDESVALVFIDYLLIPMSDSADAAVQFVKNIENAYGISKPKPLMILMSSKNLDDSPGVIGEFRRQTGYIPGLFYFISKDELADKGKLLFNLNRWVTAIPEAAEVQSFIDQLCNALPEVMVKFIKDIRELTLSDYAYVQKLGLQEDGHPLGDYMLWLFVSYLNQLLSTDEGISAKQKIIDALTFEDLPPSQLPPSVMLARLYRSTLAAEAEDNLDHARDNAGAMDRLPFLHLGDLFTNDSNEIVWMVANAQCDLMFTPDHKSRRMNKDRTVLMLPGRLQPLNKPVSKEDLAKPRTELFESNDRSYRILWDTRGLTSRPMGQIKEWKDAKGYKRTARLRLPAALAVQQAFASSMTRVGMPVAPPLYQPVAVEFLCDGEDGNAHLLKTSQHCILFRTRDGGEYCIPDGDFVYGLGDTISEAIELSEKRTEILNTRNKNTEAQKKATKLLKSCLNKLTADTLFCDGFRVPSSDERSKVLSYPIHVLRNRQVKGKQYSYDYPLVLNIVDAEVPEVADGK